MIKVPCFDGFSTRFCKSTPINCGMTNDSITRKQQTPEINGNINSSLSFINISQEALIKDHVRENFPIVVTFSRDGVKFSGLYWPDPCTGKSGIRVIDPSTFLYFSKMMPHPIHSVDFACFRPHLGQTIISDPAASWGPAFSSVSWSDRFSIVSVASILQIAPAFLKTDIYFTAVSWSISLFITTGGPAKRRFTLSLSSLVIVAKFFSTFSRFCPFEISP